MSFDQLSSMEAGRRRGGGSGGGIGGGSGGGESGRYADDPRFQKLSQQMSNKLFKLQGHMSSLGRDIGHMGTRQDNARVRERVNELLEASRELFKEVGEGVKTVQAWEDVTPTQRYQQQKLSREFQAALGAFQTLQRQALEKEKASVLAAREAAVGEGGDASGDGVGQDGQLLEQQQELGRLAPQDEVDFQEALILEREEEIRNIEQGVGDLNVLFTQVATMVHEQGEQIDNIADNVENLRTDTRGADYELRAADRYQRNARGKACCLLLVLAVILTIVLLAAILG